MTEQFDVVIVGSGFGGSVSALRLAEQGLSVAILEQGRRLSAEDLKKAGQNSKDLTWAPAMGMHGILAQDVFQHLGVVRGIGVGGGSLVYAAVLLEPGIGFYQDPTWKNLSINWQTELAPHYLTAKNMLGVAENPYHNIQDQWLEEAAKKLNVHDSFSTVPQGIFFGDPDQEVDDPFFNGKGPKRRGCNRCGSCITGCAYGAKNSLDLNYLYQAEHLGVKIYPEKRVSHLECLKDQEGYLIHTQHPWKRGLQKTIKARKVILAAGVIGTLEILFASRDRFKTLPMISKQLGEHVRTNSEAIVSILANDENIDVTQGTTISSHFHADGRTHITQNRFPASYEFMKFYMGPLVDDPSPIKRLFRVLGKLLFQPILSTKSWRINNWHKRISVLTVMQQADNELRFVYGRTLLRGGRRFLKSQVSVGERAPSFIPLANEAARQFAYVNQGTPHNNLLESVGNLSITAHLLGGAVMADHPSKGVIDINHQVYGYPGLYVVDGSAIPVNVGVNPSLTITALAERFAERFRITHQTT